MSLKTQISVLVILFLYILIGIYLSINTGISHDEFHEQHNWVINLNAIKSFITDRNYEDLLNYKDKYHGLDNPNGRSHVIADVEDFMNEFVYPDEEAKCTYTYNFDNCLSQDIQWISSGDLYKNNIIALCIHNGADARGGMTDYKFFKIDC